MAYRQPLTCPRVPLFLAAAVLLLLARATPRGTASGQPEISVGGEAGPEHAMSLYRAWTDAYGLSPDSLLPPSSVSLPPSLSPAPHLEDCAALTALRQQAEQWGEGGKEGEKGKEGEVDPPAWARPVDSCNPTPYPPWVRGTDAANLAMTRVVQRDIWANQFPGGPSCAGRRLLVVSWAPDHKHGVGSQVHVMSSFLSIAMRYNRTLVPDPLNYNRAYTNECADMNQSGRWECYFFPLVASDCERVVLAAKDANSVEWSNAGIGALCASQHRVVGVLGTPYLELDHEAGIAQRWGLPHLDRPSTVWFPPGAAHNNERTPQVHWWRAQAVRFMLRWPSAHLCHVINRQRHTAYGMHVANRIARFAETQSELLAAIKAASQANSSASSGSGSSSDAIATMAAARLPAEAAALGGISFASPDIQAALAHTPWAYEAPPSPLPHDQAEEQRGLEGVGVPEGGEGSGGGSRCGAERRGHSIAAEAVRRLAAQVGRDAYMVRPLVAVHVRQSDKEEEMELLPLPTYLYYAHHLRHLLPDLRHLWINTESQAVIDSLTSYRDWTFLYSKNARQTSTSHNTREYDDKQSVAESFASVLIASQADLFIGTLGSNWSRLKNELRSTNGRLFNPFIALNDGEW
ncbi:hypothetical protein CLOM_g6342 [Closterium sp. NIES-68]|nr:hypothetical protein CLOM_g6342 [Closterium sp. NIES-68]GJP64712.1 hypothetical protein CLOP_g21672 [Closterium sp. NIES-67]